MALKNISLAVGLQSHSFVWQLVAHALGDMVVLQNTQETCMSMQSELFYIVHQLYEETHQMNNR